jgi:hypothetical protein
MKPDCICYSDSDLVSLSAWIPVHDAHSPRSSVVCDLCAKLVPRSQGGSLANFEVHRDSGKCRAARRRKRLSETPKLLEKLL